MAFEGDFDMEAASNLTSNLEPDSTMEAYRDHDDVQHQQVQHEDITEERSIKRGADTLDTLFVGEDEHKETAQPSSKRSRVSRPQSENILAGVKIDEDGNVPPYRAFADQERPNLGIYHPGFGNAEDMIPKICNDFIDLAQRLKADGYHNQEIDLVCDRLKKQAHLKHRYPHVSPTACLGSSGVGKSSTINSILNQAGAAHEADSSTRGTNVTHEFSMPCTNETAMFLVQARYYTRKQIANLVERHCWSIFNHMSPPADSEETELDDLQRKFETAIEFFRILLCNRKEFASEEKAETYFESRLHEEADRTVQQLMEWIEDFKKTRRLRDNVEIHRAENTKELGAIFRKISRVPSLSSGVPHPWPILRKVEIHHSNDLLNAGNVIGDTPGVDDINATVVENTMNYLQKSGIILVFTKFERGAINDALDDNLLECIKLGKINDVYLVVTKIDGRVIKEDEREDLCDEDRVELEDAESLVRTYALEHKMTKQERQLAMQNKDFEKLQQLEQDLNSIPFKIALAESKVQQAMVRIKTRGMADVVKDKLRKISKSKTAPDLPIFFISNTQYQKHASGYDAKNPPTLDLEATGIPAIRRMLYAVPARGRTNTLARIGKTLLPSIFNSIIGILTKSKLERKNEVLKVVTNVLDQYTEIASNVNKLVKQQFAAQVIQVFDDNQQRWGQKADKLVDEWNNYKAMTLQAFCRKGGEWRPQKGMKMVSWNKLLLGVMADKAAEGFTGFDDYLVTLETNTITDILELYKKLEDRLEECQDFQGTPGSKEFFDGIHNIRDLVLKNMEKAFRALRGDLDRIRSACILGHKEDSFIAAAMAPTYAECLQVTKSDAATAPSTANPKRRYKGRSSVHPMRVEKLRNKVRGSGEEESVYQTVCEGMASEFEKKVDGWYKDKCIPKLKKGYDLVLEDFDHRFVVEDEVKLESDKEASEELHNAAIIALDKINGPLRQEIESFEAYEMNGNA